MTLPDFPESAAPEADAPVPQPTPKAPARYERSLVPRLIGAQKTLVARFNDLLGTFEHDPAANAAAVEDCARQFTAVRHIETIWLYPIIAQAVEGDGGARGELMELRLVAMILARRVLRSFDELTQAIRAEVLASDAAMRLATALMRYASHSERSVYPLYELVGSEKPVAEAVA